MIRTASVLAIISFLAATVGINAQAATTARNPDAVSRLEREKSGTRVSLSPATGTARFVRVPSASAARAAAPPLLAAPITSAANQAMKDSAAAFINRHSQALGLRTGTNELKLRKSESDRLGQTHLTYTQEYAGLPVFGAVLKAHLDSGGAVVAVSGTMVPDIDVSTAPSRSLAQSQKAASDFIKAKNSPTLPVRSSRLLIFREGLAKGVPGDNHLAYEVEIGNGRNIREFVYVDAHSGKVIDRISGTPDALNRRVYDGENAPSVPASYPGTPFWVEGQAFPTTSEEADNMIVASQETYNLYFNAFGRDSFDGKGATMDSIFDRGYDCPNASWNGTFISFCPGFTTDDVTAHEWSHAYTEYTDNLIYQWQPGALNEASSDIFGETVDRLNNRGTDTPDNPRTAGNCSLQSSGSPPPSFVVNSPSVIAGSYGAVATVRRPALPLTVSGEVAAAVPADACTAIGGVSGKIAVIDWAAGACGSVTKTTNAFNAGAIGVVIVADPTGLIGLTGSASIAAVQVSNADGIALESNLPAQATIRMDAATDNSVRWLLAEDTPSDTANLNGAFRDMWNPQCFGNPGKVSDKVEYACSADDQGGVHTNSGVDNHAYALMVDGGTYNGQTVAGIGLTKAAHVYFRAKTHYQSPATDFADHADALEQSCADLVGVNLASLTTGGPSGQIISAADCTQIAKTMLAVEMRAPPTQCGFQPLLAKNPPALCPGPARKVRVFFEERLQDFSRKSPTGKWSVSHSGTTPDFTARDWKVATNLPDNRPGRAFFGADPNIGTCGPGGDETAVLHLDSPRIEIEGNAKALKLAFDHWVATESGWDGGNLKISVNGGAWKLVAATDYLYNPYNTTLFTADEGSTDPIAGEPAFSGTDGGEVFGSWGRSIVNLTKYAKRDDKIRLRFDIGNDGCGGNTGWYVDNVQVFECR